MRKPLLAWVFEIPGYFFLVLSVMMLTGVSLSSTMTWAEDGKNIITSWGLAAALLSAGFIVNKLSRNSSPNKS